VSFFFVFWLMNLDGGANAIYLSVMSFVGYDYRKDSEKKGVADDDDDSPQENFDDENDNNTTGSL
jgi:hypothetical protein